MNMPEGRLETQQTSRWNAGLERYQMYFKVDPVVEGSEFEHRKGHTASIDLWYLADQIQRNIRLTKRASPVLDSKSGALFGSFLYIILPLHEVNKAKGLLQTYIALKILLSGFCIYVGWRLPKHFSHLQLAFCALTVLVT